MVKENMETEEGIKLPVQIELGNKEQQESIEKTLDNAWSSLMAAKKDFKEVDRSNLGAFGKEVSGIVRSLGSSIVEVEHNLKSLAEEMKSHAKSAEDANTPKNNEWYRAYEAAAKLALEMWKDIAWREAIRIIRNNERDETLRVIEITNTELKDIDLLRSKGESMEMFAKKYEEAFGKPMGKLEALLDKERARNDDLYDRLIGRSKSTAIPTGIVEPSQPSAPPKDPVF